MLTVISNGSVMHHYCFRWKFVALSDIQRLQITLLDSISPTRYMTVVFTTLLKTKKNTCGPWCFVYFSGNRTSLSYMPRAKMTETHKHTVLQSQIVPYLRILAMSSLMTSSSGGLLYQTLKLTSWSYLWVQLLTLVSCDEDQRWFLGTGVVLRDCCFNFLLKQNSTETPETKVQSPAQINDVTSSPTETVEFNSFQFWRAPIPSIDADLLALLVSNM